MCTIVTIEYRSMNGIFFNTCILLGWINSLERFYKKKKTKGTLRFINNFVCIQNSNDKGQFFSKLFSKKSFLLLVFFKCIKGFKVQFNQSKVQNFFWVKIYLLVYLYTVTCSDYRNIRRTTVRWIFMCYFNIISLILNLTGTTWFVEVVHAFHSTCNLCVHLLVSIFFHMHVSCPFYPFNVIYF